jgi:guanylate kinase
MERKGLLVVVSGPSGVGKSTLCKTMIAKVPDTTLSVSYTTRSPRPGEQEGVDYQFVEEETFRQMTERQEFVEWALVYGHLYGTPQNQLVQAMEQGMDVLLDIDAQGARQIMKRFTDAIYVFVVPPSLETLRTRLLRRAGDTEKEVERRFQRASEEITNYKLYHYLIRNDDLSRATHELESIILAERVKTTRIQESWLGEKGLLQTGKESKV